MRYRCEDLRQRCSTVKSAICCSFLERDIPMKNFRRALLAFAAAAVTVVPAFAQADYPNKPIKIIVPYPAGGLSDFQVRAISEPLGKLLGQPIIVDNRPGASAGIGTQAAAASPPDGYTLVFVNNGFVITPLVNKRAGYDPMKDFVPVSVVSTSPMVLVVNESVPAKDVRGFIDYAKAQPDGLDYGSAGNASFGHMATAMFSQATGVKMNHVLQGRGADEPGAAHRRGEGADHDAVALDHGGGQGGQAEVAGGRVGQARTSDAGRQADIGHRARLHGRSLVRPLRTQGHAAGGRLQTQCRAGASVGDARDQGKVRRVGATAESSSPAAYAGWFATSPPAGPT